jgi:hypothetical protein
MTHPQWILVPWAVFLCALALKFWQFGIALNRHLLGLKPSTAQMSEEEFRKTLERIWAKGQ